MADALSFGGFLHPFGVAEVFLDGEVDFGEALLSGQICLCSSYKRLDVFGFEPFKVNVEVTVGSFRSILYDFKVSLN